MKAIAGISPISGEMVDGGILEREYSAIKDELMQVIRLHKLKAGQASYVLELCKEDIDAIMTEVLV